LGAIVSEVTAKIRALVPESSGRWTDAAIGVLVHQADLMVGEQCDTTWSHTDITLVAGSLYYPLPTSIIGVGAVALGVNGTDFIDGTLFPCTISDLDESDVNWRSTAGTAPTHYSLLGAPGSESSRIMLWPAMSTVTTEKVRVTHLFSTITNNALMIGKSAAPEIQDSVYVPLVLGMMFAPLDAARANLYFRRAFDEMPSVRGGFVSPYSGGMASDTSPGVSRIGGQLR
jgi:hypothetical protein